RDDEHAIAGCRAHLTPRHFHAGPGGARRHQPALGPCPLLNRRFPVSDHGGPDRPVTVRWRRGLRMWGSLERSALLSTGTAGEWMAARSAVSSSRSAVRSTTEHPSPA